MPLCPRSIQVQTYIDLPFSSLAQNMFTDGSTLLHSATGGNLYFGEVTIVVPEAWACQGVAGSSNVAWDQANLRVGPVHSVFGQNPWTQQPRGCGEPGDFMYFPESFLLENSTLGSKGKCNWEKKDICEMKMLNRIYKDRIWWKWIWCVDRLYETKCCENVYEP